MEKRIAFIACILLLALSTSGQSSNINCATAMSIDDPVSYCSAVEEFDNENVGGSEIDPPSCWGDAQNDLWFTFVATNKSINIVMSAAPGTLDNPEIAIYKGEDCTSLAEISCEINTSSLLEITSLLESNLIVGDRYYIRVDGRTAGNDGTFRLCVESFNPPVVPGQDCGTASILCSKEGFVVENVVGNGSEVEAVGTCLEGMNGSENNSTWFKWTCDESGTFTMDLIPLIETDDYDFAIYEIDGDINSCEKTMIRCSGANGGNNEPCGPNTGLNLTSTDLEEDPNCDPGEDGYLRFIDMEAGKSYAMLINNYSDSEVGFALQFGGTATFVGPTADFSVTATSCGTEIQVIDESEMGIGMITSYEWEFGEQGMPQTASGPGPHNVEYPDFGEKTITLKITSDFGCQVFSTQSILLGGCSYIEGIDFRIDSLRNIGCGEANSGFVELSPDFECSPLEYSIDGGAFQFTPAFDNLSAGDHTISIRDENMCMVDTTITINEVADFQVDAGPDVTIVDPNNGIQLNATTTATGDVTINWTPSSGISCSDGSTNCLDPTVLVSEETTFTITITDSNGCINSDEIQVSPFQCAGTPPEINIDSIRGVTCLEPENGFISVVGNSGTPGYLYSLNGGTFAMDSTFSNLSAGTYTIAIQDEASCLNTIDITIEAPPAFEVNAGEDITIDGSEPLSQLDAMHTAASDVTINWSPGNGIICPDSMSLNCLNPFVNPETTTTYILSVIDEQGCNFTDEVTVTVVVNENFFAPNIFSPNEDGFNDIFSIFAERDVVEAIEELVIFDRWGNKVYDERNLDPTDPTAGWDGRFIGTPAAEGVYVWYANIKFVNQENARTVRGDVTLIR